VAGLGPDRQASERRLRRRRECRPGSRAALLVANMAVCLFLLAPIAVVIVASFSDRPYMVFPPQGVSLRWYRQFFESREFREALGLSVQLGLLTTAASSLLGVPASLALVSLRFRGIEVVRALFASPLMVPGIVLGIAMLIYYNRIGMANSFASLLLAHIALTLPYVVRIVSAGLQSFDHSLEEAARSLGASRARALVDVTLPLIKGSVMAAVVFAFIISFDEVVVTLFLAGPKLMTLPVAIYTYIEYTSDPSIAAISTILVVLTVGAVLVIDRTAGFTRFL
jgi:putative spermidine/putrescine transport system permease protein